MENFEWTDTDGDSVSDNCGRICGQADSGISLVNGTLDECTCAEKFFWNQTDCMINCTQENFPYSANRNLSTWDQCLCNSSFEWNASELNCVFMCAELNFSSSRVPNVTDECVCDPGYEWNATEMNCVIVCDMDFAIGRESGV